MAANDCEGNFEYLKARSIDTVPRLARCARASKLLGTKVLAPYVKGFKATDGQAYEINESTCNRMGDSGVECGSSESEYDS